MDESIKALLEQDGARSAGPHGLRRLGPSLFGHKSVGASTDLAGIDRGRMRIPVIVSTEDEDAEGDVVVTAGIVLARHMAAPTILYDHGLHGIEGGLPAIGKAEDDDGGYTGQLQPRMLRAETFFSQRSTLAYQVFDLCSEGILRGVSIGFNILDAEHRRGGRVPGGLLVKRCEMFEYSHTPVGVNPYALADRIGKGILCGRAIEAGLWKSLSPHLPALKEQARGGWDGAAGVLAEAVGLARAKAHAATPPRPGEVFDESRHRWVNPDKEGGGGDAAGPAAPAAPPSPASSPAPAPAPSGPVPPGDEAEALDRADASAASVSASFNEGLARLPEPARTWVGKALAWVKDKTAAFFGLLESRYGRRQAIAIFASGQVLSWSATGVGAAFGIPLVVPGMSVVASIPAMAAAEVYRQVRGAMAKGEATTGGVDVGAAWAEAQGLPAMLEGWLKEFAEAEGAPPLGQEDTDASSPASSPAAPPGNDGGKGDGSEAEATMSEPAKKTKAIDGDGMNTQAGADGGYVALPDPKDKAMAGDGADASAADPTEGWLPGARVLAGIHGHLSEGAGAVEEGYGQQENPEVVAVLDKAADVFAGLLDELAEAFARHYPDLDPLEGGGTGAEEKSETETGEGEKEGEGDGEDKEEKEEAAYKSRMGKRLTEAGRKLAEARRKSAKVIGGAKAKAAGATRLKRLSRSAAGVCTKAAECLDEMAGHVGEIKSSHKTACGVHSAALKALAADPAMSDGAGAGADDDMAYKSQQGQKVKALEAENARLKAGLEKADREVKAIQAEFRKARRGR